jgi:hypothetical protein
MKRDLITKSQGDPYKQRLFFRNYPFNKITYTKVERSPQSRPNYALYAFNISIDRESEKFYPFKKINYIQSEADLSDPRLSKDVLFRQIRDTVQRGQTSTAIIFAISHGIKDKNILTDLIFHARHPERRGKRIQGNEQALVKEWLDIKNRLVEPALSSTMHNAPSKPTVGSPLPASPILSLGTLRVMREQYGLPERLSFAYKFTPEDALWTARFIVGEAGGDDNPDNHAVIWAMFNRYAFFTHYGSLWGGKDKTFHNFFRRYSTPLQWPLNSWAAAERVMNRPDFVKFGGYYTGKNVKPGIPKGQAGVFLKLQSTPWHKLPEKARKVAEQIMKGNISNPGIGTATEFANTFVILRQKMQNIAKEQKKRNPALNIDPNKIKPTYQQWLQFNEIYQSKERNFKWIGLVPNLNHMSKNTFFMRALRIPGDIRNRLYSDLPSDVVQVLPP